VGNSRRVDASVLWPRAVQMKKQMQKQMERLYGRYEAHKDY
jgi:hypothetical protein